MTDMLPINSTATSEGVPNNQDIPRDEMDIFEKLPQDFLPAGKTIDELTPEEYQTLVEQYRFSPYRPGCYQGITGITNNGTIL